MTPTRRAIIGAVSTGFAISIAGCTSDESPDDDDAMDSSDDSDMDGPDGSSDGSADSDSDSSDDTDATVRVDSHDEFGDILVDSEGMTLYMFESDTQGEAASTCYDGCASSWPPLTTDESPTGAEGVSAELTTFERDDGEQQIAAAGWPLYYFSSDEDPGDATGQGVNDVWWVLAPDGTIIDGSSDTPTETETASGSGGSGGNGGGGMY